MGVREGLSGRGNGFARYFHGNDGMGMLIHLRRDFASTRSGELMLDTVRTRIERIHDTPHKTVLAVSGAGTQAVAWLLGVSGASRTILEVVVPYGRLSMQEFLGFEPTQSAAAETAKQLAHRCYQRAKTQLEDDSPAVGLACAATIATGPPQAGRPPGFRLGVERAGNGDVVS